MFARFDENPAMTLEDIKETKRYGRTDGCTHACTDNVKTVYPPQTKFAGGISLRGGIIKSDTKDLDQHSVRPDLGPNCLKSKSCFNQGKS